MLESFKIKNKIISNYGRVFIIAEAGVNHNGSIKIAKKLIDAAVFAGADAVKFQTFNTDDIVTTKSPKSRYHKITSGSDNKQTWYNMLKGQELNYEQHKELIKYCKLKKIIFLSTPYDFKSVDLLDDLKVPVFKIASTDNNNYPLLKYISKKNKPIILSTGMSNIKEVKDAINILKSFNQKKIAILQCTSSYPCKLSDLNLLVIKTFQDEFNCPIGFSDHSDEIIPAIVAASMGSSIYEKHLTLDKTMKGPDHRASCTPKELKDIVKEIRQIKILHGSQTKIVLDSEIENRIKLKKSLVSLVYIKKGEVIKKASVGIKRPATGLFPIYFNVIDQYVSKKNIKPGTILKLNMLKKK